jgi:hypothetical protein
MKLPISSKYLPSRLPRGPEIWEKRLTGAERVDSVGLSVGSDRVRNHAFITENE